MALKISYEDFIKEVAHLRANKLPHCVKTINTYFTAYVIKWSDLKFYPKNYKGELQPHDIQNSQSNRNPSINANSKKLPKKLAYGIRIMGGNSSFNYLPLGILDDTIALQGEDRGHEGGVLFFNYDTKWSVKIWRRALQILETEVIQSEQTSNTKLIVKSLKSLLNDKKIKELSFAEIVPLDIKKEKNNTYIPIELKVYPNRTFHRREILGINNNEDTWQTHQKAVAEAEITLDGIYGVGNDYFDKIYIPVEGQSLFQGELTMLAKHASAGHKMERYEEEPIMLWLSSRQYRKGSLDIYRGFDCSTLTTRITQYKTFVEAISNDKKLIDLVKTEVDFLTNVSDCVNINPFETMINDIVDKKKGKSTTNINDLSMTKMDSALMMAQIIRDYLDTRSAKLTKDVVITVGNKVLKMATELLENEKIQSELISAATGANGRYNEFYKRLASELSELPYDEVSDVKETLISKAKQQLDSSLNPNGDIPMIDRDENAKSVFKIVIVNINKGIGFEKGHKNAGIDGKDIENFFLQFTGDNGFWSNKRDFEPTTYSTEYLNSIKEFMKINELNNSDNWQDAYQNTRKFVKSVWY
jgi:hypothetical protein